MQDSLLGYKPADSQIAGHLNKAPIKIQSLSLLIGSGSDRQYEHRFFWFQKYIICEALNVCKVAQKTRSPCTVLHKLHKNHLSRKTLPSGMF